MCAWNENGRLHASSHFTIIKETIQSVLPSNESQNIPRPFRIKIPIIDHLASRSSEILYNLDSKPRGLLSRLYSNALPV